MFLSECDVFIHRWDLDEIVLESSVQLIDDVLFRSTNLLLNRDEIVVSRGDLTDVL